MIDEKHLDSHGRLLLHQGQIPNVTLIKPHLDIKRKYSVLRRGIITSYHTTGRQLLAVQPDISKYHKALESAAECNPVTHVSVIE